MQDLNVKIDEDALQKSIGNQRNCTDTLNLSTARLMQATLDLKPMLKNGDPLPHLWHWLYFHYPVETSELDRDGHEKLGGFMPSVGLNNRMWAGSRFEFIQPFIVGQTIEKQSTIKEVSIKQGKSGTLCFITLEHLYYHDDTLICKEAQDVVYKNRGSLPDANSLPDASENIVNETTVTPSNVMLFRYSALTFNSHRIHYDETYCKEDEGYPAIVVHGPLTATLMINYFQSLFPDKEIATFQFRAVSPLFHTKAFKIAYNKDESGHHLQAINHQNKLAMKAEVTLRQQKG